MPVTPQMLQLATAFRQALLIRERLAATALVRYYGEIWRRMQGDITALQDQIVRMRAAGEDVSANTIYRLDRMEAIQRQAAQELGRYAEYADGAISGAQREAIAAGEREAPRLVQAAFPRAAVEIQFGRMPRDAVEAMIGTLVDGSPLRTLLDEAVGEASQSFADTLVSGLARGLNPREVAREIRSEFGMGLTRSLRIARTEQLRAYRTASLHAYESSGVVKGWERHAAMDDRTCMACIMLDGKRYLPGDPMDDHPQGRCVMLPVTMTYQEMGIDAPEPDFRRELGGDWFARQDEATQRRMMGNAKFEAWQAGKFELADLPMLREDRTWGNSWTPRPLKDLVGEAGNAIQ